MGFKTAEWAYSLTSANLTVTDMAVLVTIALKVNDKTHAWDLAIGDLADMLHASPSTVSRSLGRLETEHIIKRTRNTTARGYRTLDTFTVDVTYMPTVLEGDLPTTQIASESDSAVLPVTLHDPSSQPAGAINNQPPNQPPSQPKEPAIDLEALFDDAWDYWPKKVDRKDALAKFKVVTRKQDPQWLVGQIIAHGEAHKAFTDRQFIPGLAVWLNKERWNNPLPESPAASSARKPTRAEENLALVRRLQAAATAQKDIAS